MLQVLPTTIGGLGHVYFVIGLGSRQCVLMFGGGAKDYTEKMLECCAEGLWK